MEHVLVALQIVSLLITLVVLRDLNDLTKHLLELMREMYDGDDPEPEGLPEEKRSSIVRLAEKRRAA